MKPDDEIKEFVFNEIINPTNIKFLNLEARDMFMKFFKSYEASANPLSDPRVKALVESCKRLIGETIGLTHQDQHLKHWRDQCSKYLAAFETKESK